MSNPNHKHNTKLLQRRLPQNTSMTQNSELPSLKPQVQHKLLATRAVSISGGIQSQQRRSRINATSEAHASCTKFVSAREYNTHSSATIAAHRNRDDISFERYNQAPPFQIDKSDETQPSCYQISSSEKLVQQSIQIVMTGQGMVHYKGLAIEYARA